nr:hypothetical protein [Tanacetum cinerariifolium]
IISSITAQEAKLDLELVLNEKRLEIRKCNGRLNLGKIQREPTFQVVLDALALTLCYSAFLITVDVSEVYMRYWSHWEINSLNDVVVDHMHQPWRTFAALINKRKTTCLDKLHLSRGQILWGATPPKKAQKFKKPASPKLTIVPVSIEEPMGKSKRVKRPTKKSTEAPTIGVVIRESPDMPFTKKKEKSMRDFYKTHLSGSGTISKTAPSVAKIKPSVTSQGTVIKPGVLDVSGEESSKSEAKSWGNK